MKAKHTIRGNALFLILIAIVLLGGLTVLLTRTGSQTDETGSAEQMAIWATTVTKHAAGLKTTVNNLRSRGCGENQISFWYDSNGDGIENGTDDYYNATAPTDHSCHVFYPEGGGMKRLDADAFFKDGLWGTSGSLFAVKYSIYGASAEIKDAGKTDGTAASTDITWALEFPYNINRAAYCSAINKALGLSGVVPVANMGNMSNKFVGTFPVPTPGAVPPVETEFQRKQSFCYSYSADTQRHIFFYALHVR